MAGHRRRTISLTEAIFCLPSEAAAEGDANWEALQRAAVYSCRNIENSLWAKKIEPLLEPGHASSPDLKVSETTTGQAARTEMTRVQVLHPASTLTAVPARTDPELDALSTSSYFIVRHLANEARLARAYSTGAGFGYIKTLLTFDRSIFELSAARQRGMSFLNPDDGPQLGTPVSPERWFGLFCAGAICTDSNLHNNLEIWLNESRQMLGEQAVLTHNIQMLLNGASAFDSLESTIMDVNLPSLTRYGAALRLLLEPLSAEKTLNVQAFLSWGTMSDDGVAFQKLFNLHVARRFARYWRSLVKDSFQFYSPRTSIPTLVSALDEVERGNATLMSLLIAAANALAKPLGDLVDRVL